MEYPGTVLVVSHDREFVNNVVTSTLVFEGDAQVNEYVGGYDDWLQQSKKKNKTAGDAAKKADTEKKPGTPAKQEKPKTKPKTTKREQVGRDDKKPQPENVVPLEQVEAKEAKEEQLDLQAEQDTRPETGNRKPEIRMS